MYRIWWLIGGRGWGQWMRGRSLNWRIEWVVIPLPGLRNTDFMPKAELSFGHADFEVYYEISKGRYMVECWRSLWPGVQERVLKCRCMRCWDGNKINQTKHLTWEENVPKDTALGKNIHKTNRRSARGTDWMNESVQSVQSLSHVRLIATPWIAACQASLSITNSRSLLKLMSIGSVMPSSHLILCRPLLLLPSIPPSIRVFSNESILLMRWPKYWSFSFSISPSNEHPGLISFRMDG